MKYSDWQTKFWMRNTSYSYSSYYRTFLIYRNLLISLLVLLYRFPIYYWFVIYKTTCYRLSQRLPIIRDSFRKISLITHSNKLNPKSHHTISIDFTLLKFHCCIPKPSHVCCSIKQNGLLLLNCSWGMDYIIHPPFLAKPLSFQFCRARNIAIKISWHLYTMVHW